MEQTELMRVVLLELQTYRRTGHSRRDATQYQPSEEKEAWFRRDPIDLLGRALVEQGRIDAPGLEAIRERIVGEFNQMVEVARQRPAPVAEDLVTDVLA